MLFSALFVPSRLSDAVSERAWLQAMLDAEGALARAEANLGVIPAAAAEEIERCCVVERFDAGAIGVEARQVGNPVEPLVRDLRRLTSAEASRYVHFGATSQDILDTASMLVARQALAVVEGDLAGIADRCASLATDHRDTLMVGRTLLQHALPITFGLKAAEWLAGLTRVRAGLHRLHTECLAAELGGAVGTLASLGDMGVDVLHEFARSLGLLEPELPWHTERTRVSEIASALGRTAGVVDKIALDITLLAQTEVGEVTESGEGRHGGSSTMPQKHNPVGSVLTRACAREAQAYAEVLTRSMAQEHERAAGAWHAEWQSLTGALAFTGGAAAWLCDVMNGLEVHPEHMRHNLDATHGLVMAERITLLLSERMGRDEAHGLVRSLSWLATGENRTLRESLLADGDVRRHVSVEEIESAMEPATYLGSTHAFIDRALSLHQALQKE